MDVALVHRGGAPHSAHREFAEAIDADLIGLDRIPLGINSLKYSIPEEILNGATLPEYDVYVAEGTRTLYGLFASRLYNDGSLVYLAADGAPYKLTDEDYEFEAVINSLIDNYGIGLMKWMFGRCIDGVIANSPLCREYTSPMVPSKPVRVTTPHIESGLFKTLGEVSPSLGEDVAVMVGSFDRYKGQDILAEAWKMVHDTNPEAELRFIGKGYPDSIERVPGVSVLGYVEDLPANLAEAALYVQPSRIDSFAVSVVEAMRSGLPAIVTETTGAKLEVTKLGDEFVTEPAPEALAKAITEYFDRTLAERQDLSETARQLGTRYDSETSKQQFEEEFNGLLKEI